LSFVFDILPKDTMSHRSALAALRAARAGGKSRLESYQVEDQGAIYDEVDEEGYKKVVRGRLNRDDFVVDDAGEGYADDGREEWQNERTYYSSDEAEEAPLKGKAAKRKREEDREKNEKTNHKIMNYFNSGPEPAAPKPKVWYLLEVELLMLTTPGANNSRR
jgi:DNA polymerase alpha subunit A